MGRLFRIRLTWAPRSAPNRWKTWPPSCKAVSSWTCNNAWVTRLKLLAKWNPKKYGDRQILAGDSENPLEVQNDAMTILAAAVKNLELKRQTSNE
jgi:hypothetical protein